MSRRRPRATIDPERVEVLRSIGPADGSLLAELVDAFVSEAPKNVASIVAAGTSGDAVALGAAAHHLKGAAANVGATGVADVCAELEDAAREGRVDVVALVFELETELSRAAAAFRDVRALEPGKVVPPPPEESPPPDSAEDPTVD